MRSHHEASRTLPYNSPSDSVPTPYQLFWCARNRECAYLTDPLKICGEASFHRTTGSQDSWSGRLKKADGDHMTKPPATISCGFRVRAHIVLPLPLVTCGHLLRLSGESPYRPPSYASHLATISYDFRVRVHIVLPFPLHCTHRFFMSL